MRHIEGWKGAADALGVRVSGPVTILLPSGATFDVEMHFPDVGARKGMLVVADYEVLRPHRLELLDEGYGYSVFAAPREGEKPSPESLAELLTDWGWSGPR